MDVINILVDISWMSEDKPGLKTHLVLDGLHREQIVEDVLAKYTVHSEQDSSILLSPSTRLLMPEEGTAQSLSYISIVRYVW